MALSGQMTASNSYGGLRLSWTATQDHGTRTSTVTVSVYIISASPIVAGSGMSAALIPYTGNTTIFFSGASLPGLVNNYPVGTYSVTIPHDTNGEASFQLTAGGNFGGVNAINTVEFVLDTLYGASGVTSTSGYIGSAVTITIASPSTALTHTLTYKFGSLTGTIATKTSNTSVSWTLPTSFYNQIPNALSLTGTIYCETFAGTASLGTTSCAFTGSVNKNTCSPTLNPTVKNISTAHVALTGSNNYFIRYESSAEYTINAAAKNGASLVSQSVTCGSKVITNVASGVIEKVPSAIFVFRAVDSRGLVTEKTLTYFIADYVQPTCNQEVSTELVGETGAKVVLKVFGNYFNSTFGAVNNTLKVEVRHTQLDGTMGVWIVLSDQYAPALDGNTYSLELEVSGFEYTQSIVFQSRVTDKLHTISTNEYMVKVTPVFDWGKEDFNLNVPLNMDGETILRHSISANDLVVSSTGSNIYLRPGGTNDTSGEVRIYSNGNLELKGDLIINGVNVTTALKNFGILPK